MKNTIRVEHEKRLMVMDRTFAKLSANVRNPEYPIMQNARRDYPDYAAVTRQFKKNPMKDTYAGLTYQYMEDYIILPYGPPPFDGGFLKLIPGFGLGTSFLPRKGRLLQRKGVEAICCQCDANKHTLSLTQF